MDRMIRLTVKVRRAHKEALERIGLADDETAAAVVRRLIRNEAQRRGLWPCEGRDRKPGQEASR